MSDRQNIQTTESKTSPAPAQRQASERERAMVPRVDVIEDDNGITLWADLPGVAKDQLDLKIEGDMLQIEAPVTPALPERLQPLYAEVRVPRYRRAFTLSRELDTGRVEANLKDGVLQLRIPKHEHAQPRRIQVQVA
jgi:HSP20 family molecular chaperone IbpA